MGHEDFKGNNPEAEKKEREEYEKRRLAAMKRWNENGHWGVTADDHWAIGGSPDWELNQNPGKTLGELWDMEKITEKFREKVAYLEKERAKYSADPNGPESHWAKGNIISVKKSLRLTTDYLRSIGKLPEEFDGFEVTDEPGDPT
jgi:hypothetical protein